MHRHRNPAGSRAWKALFQRSVSQPPMTQTCAATEFLSYMLLSLESLRNILLQWIVNYVLVVYLFAVDVGSRNNYTAVPTIHYLFNYRITNK